MTQVIAPRCVCQICTCGKHKCPKQGHSRVSINPDIPPCIGMKHMKSEYNDNYRDWFKEHWVKDEWVAPETPQRFSPQQQIETNPELMAIAQPNVRNAVLRSPKAAATNGRFQRLQQYEPKHYYVNDQGLKFAMKTLEMDALNAKDDMIRQKKRANELEEKLSFLQSTLLTQNQKIKTKNQIINEMNDALESMTMKYNQIARQKPALERRIKQYESERQDWKTEKASMVNEVNNIASQKVYEVDKMCVFQSDLKRKLEEKNAMISLLDDNIDKLKKDLNVQNDTKSKLQQMKAENNRLKMLLESKQLELSKMRQIFATEEKVKCAKRIKNVFDDDDKENGNGRLKDDYGEILKSISNLENNAKTQEMIGKKQKLVKRKKLSYHQRKLQRNLKNVVDTERCLRQELDFVDKAYKALDN